jgi:hypothetical protein
MPQPEYGRVYSTLTDEKLLAIHSDRVNLVEDAVRALTLEMVSRGLDPTKSRSNKAYEALDGIVVTEKDVQIPRACVRCCSPDAPMRIRVASSDPKVGYRFFYIKFTTQLRDFYFCRSCFEAIGANGLQAGVSFGNFPTTTHELFHFENSAYQQLFLQANE